MLYEFEERLQHHDIRERTAQALGTHYRMDRKQAARVEQSVLTLADAQTAGAKIYKAHRIYEKMLS